MFRSLLFFVALVQCAEFFNDPSDANEDLFSDILPPMDQMVEGSGWGNNKFIKTADADLPYLKTRPCLMKPGDISARITWVDIFPDTGVDGTTVSTTTNTATSTENPSELPTTAYGLNATNWTGIFIVDGKYMGGGKYKKNKICLVMDRASAPAYRWIDLAEENLNNVTRNCPHKWAGSCNCSAQIACSQSAIHGRIVDNSRVCNDALTIGNPLFKHGLKNPWRYAHALNDLVTSTGTITTGYNPLYFKNYPAILFDDQGTKASCKQMSYVPKLAEFLGNAPSWTWISDFTPGSVMTQTQLIGTPGNPNGIAVTIPVRAPLPGRPLNKYSKSGVVVIRQHPQNAGAVDIWMKFAWLRSIHKGNNTLGIPKSTGECWGQVRYACAITFWEPTWVVPDPVPPSLAALATAAGRTLTPGETEDLTCENFYDLMDNDVTNIDSVIPPVYNPVSGGYNTLYSVDNNLITQSGSYQNMAYFENVEYGVSFYGWSSYLAIIHDNFGIPVWCSYLSQCKVNKKKLKQRGIYKSCYK